MASNSREHQVAMARDLFDINPASRYDEHKRRLVERVFAPRIDQFTEESQAQIRAWIERYAPKEGSTCQ